MGVTLEALAEAVGLPPESPLFLQALTHRAAAPDTPSYERLEWLGDAVLGWIAARHLYTALPDSPPRDLTEAKKPIVAEAALAEAAQRLNLAEHIRIDANGRNLGHHRQPRVLSNVVEALIGALYQERGLDAAEAFVHTLLADALAMPSTEKSPKNRLQERVQEHFQQLPEYVIEASTEGNVTVAVYDPHHTLLGRGVGRSQSEAEIAAAEDALSR